VSLLGATSVHISVDGVVAVHISVPGVTGVHPSPCITPLAITVPLAVIEA